MMNKYNVWYCKGKHYQEWSVDFIVWTNSACWYMFVWVIELVSWNFFVWIDLIGKGNVMNDSGVKFLHWGEMFVCMKDFVDSVTLSPIHLYLSLQSLINCLNAATGSTCFYFFSLEAQDSLCLMLHLVGLLFLSFSLNSY